MDVMGWECAELRALRAILGEEGVATVCCAGVHAACAGSCDHVVSAACDRTKPSLSAPAMQHARLRPCRRLALPMLSTTAAMLPICSLTDCAATASHP